MTTRTREGRISSIRGAVGATPVLRLATGAPADGAVFAKLECLNPAGSFEDRLAVDVLERALASGALRRGDSAVLARAPAARAVSFACVAASLGVELRLGVIEGATSVHRSILRRFGASTEPGAPLTATPYTLEVASDAASEELVAELRAQVGEVMTHLVVPDGSATEGLTRALARHWPSVRCVPVGVTGGEASYSEARCDVPRAHAIEAVSTIAREYGCVLGVDSAAATLAAQRLAQGNAGRATVALWAERGDRFLEPRRWERQYDG